MTCVDNSGCLVASSPQACTTPNTCQGSAGSATCQCPAAGTVAGSGCATQNQTACDTASSNVDTCTLVNGCLIWQQTSDCTTTGLLCRSASGAPACNCPDNTSTSFYADSVNGSDVVADGGLAPTGLQSPAGCRFGSLTHALAQATAINSDDGGAAEVVATGAPAAGNMVFTEQASGNTESFPLNVNGGITLRADTSGGGTYTITFNDAAATSALAVGAAGSGTATVTGFGVAFGTGANAAADGLDVSGAASLNTLTVTGPGASTSTAPGVGINVTGASAADQTGVTVSAFRTGEIYASSAASTLGTVTLDSNGLGLDIRSGTLTATALTVSNSTNAGITTANAAGGTPTVTLSSSSVNDNGKSGAGATGINWNAGTLYMTGVSVVNNGVHGLHLAGAALVGDSTTPVTNCHFDSNGQTNTTSGGFAVENGTATLGTGNTFSNNLGNGILLTGGGTIIASSPTINGNGGEGVLLSSAGGHTTLHSPTVNNNTNRGLFLSNGTLTVDGTATITGNGTGTNKVAGVRASAGTLSIGVQGDATQIAELAGNGSYGLHLTGAAATVYYANIHDNGARGVNVNSTGVFMTIDHADIHDNGGAGVMVEQAAPPSGSSSNVVHLTNSEVHGNQDGVDLGNPNATTNNLVVVADITGNSIHDNEKVGVVEDVAPSSGLGNSSTKATLNSNDIYANGATFTGTVPTYGIVFTNGSLNSNGFESNKVHSNHGNQISVATTFTTRNLSSADCNSANEIYCYDSAHGGVGLTAAAVGLGGTKVTADFWSWANSPPAGNTDYSGSVNTPVTADVCSAVSSCP